jgi:hypothetical protein
MAIKTFTTGEVLTASDTNTYLANSGLVLITSGITVSSAGGTAATVANGTVTIGTSNTSVTVNGAFSANFDAYKIMITGGAGSTATALKMHLGSANTNNYYGMLIYGGPSSTAVAGANDDNQPAFTYAGGFDTNTISANIELQNPFSSTDVTEIASRVRYGPTYGNYVGVYGDTTSFTGFTFTTFSGNITGGTIRVYGYRQV